MKKNVKITKENIPAATQLFTPDWIVRYMVENSLGRLWVEGHPNNDLKANWKYYLEEADQEPEVQAQLADIRKEYAALKPEDITCIDPCCGSGHILAYLFDVLMQIYESYGYTSREAVENIIRHNLYGLDIDERAAQLAYFSVMMKARQYDRRFFSRNLQPNIYAIQESNSINPYLIDYFCNGAPQLKAAITSILDDLNDAKEYGSILTITPVDFAALYARFDQIWDDISMYKESVLNNLLPLVQVAEILAKTYDVVVTNPPYRGVTDCCNTLVEYVKKMYPNSKNDLSTVFMEKTFSMCVPNGFMAMINIPVWMSKSSFEKLRYLLLSEHTFINMLHCGRGIFGSDFGTTAFVMGKRLIYSYTASFYQLFDEMGAVDSVEQKKRWFFEKKGGYIAQQKDFLKISSYPIAYSTSKKLLNILDNEKPLKFFSYPRKGLTTGDNDRFVRFWFEISQAKFGLKNCNGKWFPMTKGGEFRRWYGNNEYVVDWENDGFAIKNFKDEHGHLRSRPQNIQFYFREGISWNDTTAIGKIAFRYQPEGYISNASGPCVFADQDLVYLFGLLNSIVSQKILEILAPNMKFEVGQMALVPIIMKPNEYIDTMVHSTTNLARDDWDSFETSWDFVKHPLIAVISKNRILFDDIDRISLAECYMCWKNECEERFQQLKANEEELNRIFIDIYGLQDELTPEVEDKDVTVYRIFDERSDIPESMGSSKYALTKQDVVKSLISYAVGCMFGRYSLDVDGLAYAGGEWDSSKYITYPADKDNIIPICDDEYFDDDIVGRFVKFIEVVYGKETLEDNLKFIADALGGKGQPKDVIRNYFLKDFYKDHCKTYQKCPIYWLFDSGKKNGFKALIYMHRYQPDTIARIRTDYVHEQQARYHTAIDDIEQRLQTATSSDRVKLNKALKKLTEQNTELRTYEEKIHHLADKMTPIDLDEGVKKNYDLFQDVLAKIK